MVPLRQRLRSSGDGLKRTGLHLGRDRLRRLRHVGDHDADVLKPEIATSGILLNRTPWAQSWPQCQHLSQLQSLLAELELVQAQAASRQADELRVGTGVDVECGHRAEAQVRFVERADAVGI